MGVRKLSSRCRLGALVLGGACFATGANADLIPEAGGGSIGSAQVIVASGNDTIVGGVSGDATLIGSGVATITSGVNGAAGRFRTSLAGGTPNGQYTMASHANNGEFGGDGTARQYSDVTFTTEVFFDDDDGPGLYPEFRLTDATAINGDGTVHLEFGEFGDNADLVFGYDVLDVTSATRNTDFFSFTGLLPGSTLTAELLSDGLTYGFFDGRLRMFDSGGGLLVDVDSDNSTGPNPYFEVTSTIVPGDGIIVIEAAHSGNAARAGGTYNLQVDSSVIPEPSSLILIGLGLMGGLIRRR